MTAMNYIKIVDSTNSYVINKLYTNKIQSLLDSGGVVADETIIGFYCRSTYL